MNRKALAGLILADLREKMVLLGGPRQVGKTTLALSLLGSKRMSPRHVGYLNWDYPPNRASLIRGELPVQQGLIVLDELHKYARWRNLLTGLYDHHKGEVSFLVAGSARLDHYRKGGDSLQGRYHYWRLHPFSLNEMTAKPGKKEVDLLLRFGGFPEPLTKSKDKFWRRWQVERVQRVVHDDLRDLEQIREISLIETLIDALPARVGSPLSIKRLKEDLQVAHETVERWIQILENLYHCFRILPYGYPKIRAVKKERKLYFWDWSQSPAGGPRFENLVASQLLKFCHRQEDEEGYRMELRYLRDTDKREIDFVVLRDKVPLFAVECKSGDSTPAPHLNYFKTRTPIPSFYQVHLGVRDYGSAERDVRVLPFHVFCRELNLP